MIKQEDAEDQRSNIHLVLQDNATLRAEISALRETVSRSIPVSAFRKLEKKVEKMDEKMDTVLSLLSALARPSVMVADSAPGPVFMQTDDDKKGEKKKKSLKKRKTTEGEHDDEKAPKKPKGDDDDSGGHPGSDRQLVVKASPASQIPTKSESIKKTLEKKKEKFEAKQKKKADAFEAKLAAQEERLYAEREARIAELSEEEIKGYLLTGQKRKRVETAESATEGELPIIEGELAITPYTAVPQEPTPEPMPIDKQRVKTKAIIPEPIPIRSFAPEEAGVETKAVFTSSDEEFSPTGQPTVLSDQVLIEMNQGVECKAVDSSLPASTALPVPTVETQQQIQLGPSTYLAPINPNLVIKSTSQAGAGSSSGASSSIPLLVTPAVTEEVFTRNPGKQIASEEEEMPTEFSAVDPAIKAEARRLGMNAEELAQKKIHDLAEYEKFVMTHCHQLDHAIYIDAYKLGMTVEQYMAMTELSLATAEEKRQADLAAEMGFDSVEAYQEQLNAELKREADIQADYRLAVQLREKDEAEKLKEEADETVNRSLPVRLPARPSTQSPGLLALNERLELKKFEDAATRRNHPARIEFCQRVNDKVIKIKRESQYAENVDINTLVKYGFTEWMELLEFYQIRQGKTRDQVLHKLQELFDRSKKAVGTPKMNVFAPVPRPKKPKKKAVVQTAPRIETTETAPSYLLNPDTVTSQFFNAALRFPKIKYQLVGDFSLPKERKGFHGEVLTHPEHGMYFNDGSMLRFQRSSLLPQESVQHLVNLRGVASLSDHARSYEAVIVNEMRRRGLNPDDLAMLLPVKEEEDWT